MQISFVAHEQMKKAQFVQRHKANDNGKPSHIFSRKGKDYQNALASRKRPAARSPSEEEEEEKEPSSKRAALESKSEQPRSPFSKSSGNEKARQHERKNAPARDALPVCAMRNEILNAVQTCNVVIVQGETGSGKSTQIPQFLAKAGFSCIAVTQPRRIPAISLAERVASEMNCAVGSLVGYSVRFEERCSLRTKIKFLTDGTILREAIAHDSAENCMLAKYDCIILDEAHERSVRTDVLIGLVRSTLLPTRPNLRIIVMSATLDCELFADHLRPACRSFKGLSDKGPGKPGMPIVLRVPGRQHEIRVFHTLEPVTDYVDATMRTINYICKELPPGDILAFLTGQEDIVAAAHVFRQYAARLPGLTVHTLYANVPIQQQRAAVSANTNKSNNVSGNPSVIHRKLVLSTNVAETSLTIPGVRYVIDCGLAKIKRYDPKTKVNMLLEEPISRAAALQRAGRAGREAPGMVFRLYTEDGEKLLTERRHSEIESVDLAGAVLLLKSIGVNNITGFPFLERPTMEAIFTAHKRLVLLEALSEEKFQLTNIGKFMARLPLDPSKARVLAAVCNIQNEAENLNKPAKFSKKNKLPPLRMSKDLLSLIALMDSDNVFLTNAAVGSARERVLTQHAAFASPDGDHLTWLNVLRAYEASGQNTSWCIEKAVNQRSLTHAIQVRKQLKKLLERYSDDTLEWDDNPAPDDLLRALLCGHMEQVAFLESDGRYKLSTDGHFVSIHPTSSLHGSRAQTVFFSEIVGSSGGRDIGRWYIRGVSRIDDAWIREMVQKL